MKKVLSIVMVLMLLSVMFAGCAKTKDEETEKETVTKTEDVKTEDSKTEEDTSVDEVEEKKVDKIKVTSGLWSKSEEQQFIREEILPAFLEETGIEVELEVIDEIDKVLKSQKDSGKWTSDIIITHSGDMPRYIESEFVQVIDEFKNSLDITVIDTFSEATMMNNQTYYIPIAADVYLLMANKKALPYLPEGAKIDSLTWEQYKDWAIAIAEVEGPKVSFPAEPIKSVLYQMGGISLSYGGGFPDINSDSMKLAWDLVGEMIANDAILSTSFNYSSPTDQMKSEEAWLTFYHMAPVGDIYGAAPARYEVGPAPAGPNGNGTIAGAWGIGITTGTEKVEAAETFIRYITSADVLYKISAGTGGFIPPVEEVIAELGNEPKDIIMKEGLGTLNNGKPSGVPSSNYTDWGAVKSVYDTVFKTIWDNNGIVTTELLDEQQAVLEGLVK